MTRPDRHPRRNAAMPDRARPELRVDPEPVRRHLESGDSGGVFVWIGVMALLAIVAYAVFLVVVALMPPAPRSAPEPTALFDVSQGASAPEPAGASRSEAEQRRPAGDELNLLVAGAPPRFRGLATWCAPTPDHCRGWDEQYVGAVPSFRFGDEPYAVQVCLADEPASCTHVVVSSHCACGDRRGEPTVIDLSVPAFRELAPLSRGVIGVIVSDPIEVPVGPTLPATETQP